MLNSTITNGDLTLNWQQNLLTLGNKTAHVPPQISDLLQVFLEQPGIVLSKTFLLNRLYGHTSDERGDLNLRVAVCYLRRALRKVGSNTDIVSHRERGYQLMSENPSLEHYVLTKQQAKALRAILHHVQRNQPELARLLTD